MRKAWIAVAGGLPLAPPAQAEASRPRRWRVGEAQLAAEAARLPEDSPWRRRRLISGPEAVFYRGAARSRACSTTRARSCRGGANAVGTLTFNAGFANGFDGTYPQDSLTTNETGLLEIEIAGAASFDRIVAIGTLTCTGTLDVAFIDGYLPAERTVFDILDGNPIAGTFATVNLPEISGASWITDDLYTTGEIEYIPPPSGTAVLIR
jgi:hypothetical protein